MTAQPLAGRRVLAGKRILVTRAAHQAGKLSEGLRALGAEPVEVPVLEIQPAESFDATRYWRLRRLDTYDWLVFTSANTVRCSPLARRAGNHFNSAKLRRVAAVGAPRPTLPNRLVSKSIWFPKSYVAESLVARTSSGRAAQCQRHDFSRADKWPSKGRGFSPEGSLRGQRILLARAEVARDVIPDALRAAAHGRCGRRVQKCGAGGCAGAVARRHWRRESMPRRLPVPQA